VRDATNQIDDLVLEAKKVIECGFRVLVTTLTKKMAEEVTNYFTSLSLRVRYLHSDIDTIERMEIIRDLRLGVFDILVGINLLREGLDLPEVALVAILDADKEGFLRSERSLIQTIGRAARNEEGRVILYAYKETKSMHKAMSETKRRREVQEKFNQEHGISPKTIIKAVSGGVIETLRGTKGKREKGIEVELSDLNPRSIEEKIKELKVEMKLLAKELKFEEAAAMRDEIKVLQEARLLL
jgi:excinuclease ABC subunit B